MAGARGELGSVFGCEGLGPGQWCFQVADLGRPDIVVIRDNETMMLVVAVCVEDRRSEAQRPSLPAGGPKRPKAPCAPCRPVGQSGSDGALNRPCAQQRQG